MNCDSLESDAMSFHPDDSGRIIHVGPNTIKWVPCSERTHYQQTDIHDAWWRGPSVEVFSILKRFPLRNLLLLSVLKLVGDPSSDVQSRLVKDFSMVTHRDSRVRAVLFRNRRWIRCILVFLWSFVSILSGCSHPNQSPSPPQAAPWGGGFISWMMTPTKRCCSSDGSKRVLKLLILVPDWLRFMSDKFTC